MSDTVIRKTDKPVIVTNPSAMTVALNLPSMDTNRDNKIDKNETLAMMYGKLPKEHQNLMKQMCQRGNTAPIAQYVAETQQAAAIATNMGLVTEVVVPGVPSLCARAQSISL